MSDEAPKKLVNLSEQAGSPNINIDEIEVDVLIIGKHKSYLEQAANFLSRRGFPTKVITSISDSIEYVAKNKPDFILISYSHSSSSIGKLPELIAQTFNLECIGFIERMDAQSTAKLNQARVKHKIQGQPSGPNLHRSLRKILAEKFNFATENERSDTSSTYTGEKAAGFVKIKGSVQAQKGTGVIVQKSDKFTKGLGTTIQSGTSGGGSASAVQEAPDALEYSEIVEGSEEGDIKRKRKKLKELTGFIDVDEKASGNMLFGAEVQEGAKAKNYDVVENPIGYEGSPKKKAWAQENDALGEAISKDTVSSKNIEAQWGGGISPPVMTEEELVEKMKQELNVGADFESEGADYARRLERALSEGLAAVMKPDLEGEPEILEDVDELLVMPLHSAEFPGYLVMAWKANSNSEKEDFLKLMQSGMQTSLGSIGLSGTLAEGFWLRIPRTDFYRWASETAKFQTTMIHKLSEVGLAFFPNEAAIYEPKMESNLNMYEIDVNELDKGEPITFNAYLYFPKNQRRFLYLREGRTLHPGQTKRLLGHEVQHFYLKESDLVNLRKFLAITYILEKVRKNSKAAA